MLYLIILILTCFYVWIWSKYNVTVYNGIVFFMFAISALTLSLTILGGLIASDILLENEKCYIKEQEVQIYNNEITNEYYIINSKGKIINEHIEFQTSKEVTKPTALEVYKRVDFDNWLKSIDRTEYKILIPTS